MSVLSWPLGALLLILGLRPKEEFAPPRDPTGIVFFVFVLLAQLALLESNSPLVRFDISHFLRARC